MPNRFCAICGKILGEEDPHYGLCLKCYLKENPLFQLPNNFSFNFCLDCGSFAKKDEWIEPEKNELFFTIKQAIRTYLLKHLIKKHNIDFSIILNEDSYVYSSKDLLISLEVGIHGVLINDPKIQHEEKIKIHINYILCKNCSNLRGGTYFLSIIQLRVKQEDQFNLIGKVIGEINEYVESLFEKNPKQYISKIEDQKFGVDLYLSTNEVMNYIIKFLKSNYYFLLKKTKKLVGRDRQRGKNLYRLKTLIKFLPVSINDVILVNNETFSVENITKNKVILRSENNTKLIKDYSYFFNENIIIKNL